MREAPGAAERGRGHQGRSLSRKERERRATSAGSIPGWCQRGVAACRSRREPIDSRRARSRGSRSLARGKRLRNASGAAEPSTRHEPRLEQRRATPDPWIDRSKRSGGKNSQESNGPASSPWPGCARQKGTCFRGEQSFEAGVPATKRRARCNERSAVSLCGGAVWRLRGSHVTVRRPGSSGAKDRRVGESYRDEPLCTAPCSGRERTARKQGPERSGTALRKKKALKGSSRARAA